MPMTGFYNKSGHFEEDEDKDEGKEATMMPTSNDPASATADEQSKGRRLNGAAKGRRSNRTKSSSSSLNGQESSTERVDCLSVVQLNSKRRAEHIFYTGPFASSTGNKIRTLRVRGAVGE